LGVKNYNNNKQILTPRKNHKKRKNQGPILVYGDIIEHHYKQITTKTWCSLPFTSKEQRLLQTDGPKFTDAQNTLKIFNLDHM
jgi:hypothetical protein